MPLELFEANWPDRPELTFQNKVELDSVCTGCQELHGEEQELCGLGVGAEHLWTPGPTEIVICDFCQSWALGDWNEISGPWLCGSCGLETDCLCQ